jgi:hypothetical protein
MCWYAVAKDFAGPAATVIAAAAAVFVTYRFNSAQVKISREQKNIALDKLKQDVFNQRYAIYTATKDLIEYVMHQHDFQQIDNARIRQLRVTLDESRFFFGPSVRGFIAEIDATSEQLLKALGDKWQNDDQRKEPAWTATITKLGDASRKLSEMYAELPVKFEEALRYDQIARD